VGLTGVREEFFTAPDGTELVTWRAAPASPDKPTIVYFHGNGGNLTNRASYFQRFLARGWGLAALSFRG
jgi:dipeptidyl aminopeptidase/acylaminoacyl peptidase